MTPEAVRTDVLDMLLDDADDDGADDVCCVDASSESPAHARCARCSTLHAKVRELQRENDMLRQQLQLARHPAAATTAETSTTTGDTAIPPTPDTTASSYSPLTRSELQRYGRQMLVGEFGVTSQLKLRNAKVLVVGVGGLGSPIAMYLSAMGVGHLGLIDGDHVERSNLHRQVIHDETSLREKKVHSAHKRIAVLNPDVQCRVFPSRLTPQNALALVSQYDVVVDASDNVATRYLVNDVCALARKPLVSGSALGLEGQVTVFTFDEASATGCYRCLYPNPPGKVQSCEENGVIGVVPGIIGCLQAMETIKVVTGMGQPLVGVQCFYDAYDGQFRRLKIGTKRNRDCLACSPARHTSSQPASLRMEQIVCTSSDANAPVLAPENRISVQHFAALRRESNANDTRRYVLLDTRPRNQFDMVHFPEAIHVPFDKHFLKKQDPQTTLLLAKCGLSPPTAPDGDDNASPAKPKTIFVICRRGVDSIVATQVLLANGAVNVQNVDGGYVEYAQVVDPTFPMY